MVARSPFCNHTTRRRYSRPITISLCLCFVPVPRVKLVKFSDRCVMGSVTTFREAFWWWRSGGRSRRWAPPSWNPEEGCSHNDRVVSERPLPSIDIVSNFFSCSASRVLLNHCVKLTELSWFYSWECIFFFKFFTERIKTNLCPVSTNVVLLIPWNWLFLVESVRVIGLIRSVSISYSHAFSWADAFLSTFVKIADTRLSSGIKKKGVAVVRQYVL